jgi:hypothetical protein
MVDLMEVLILKRIAQISELSSLMPNISEPDKPQAQAATSGFLIQTITSNNLYAIKRLLRMSNFYIKLDQCHDYQPSPTRSHSFLR